MLFSIQMLNCSVLLNKSLSLVYSTAQIYLKKQQESELAALTKKTASDTQ
jgi:hypothetical protein